MAGPEDSIDWMTTGQADLDAELSRRQAELNADPGTAATQASKDLAGDAGSAAELTKQLKAGC